MLIAILAGKSAGQDSVSISDFRYPETKAIDLKGGLSGYFSSDQYDESYPLVPLILTTAKGNSGDGNLNASANFLFFHTKDNHDQSFTVSAQGSNSFSNNEDTRVDTVTRRRESSRVDWGGSVSADWSYLHYITEDGIHLIGGSTVDYYTTHSRRNSLTDGPVVVSSSEQVSGSYSVRFHGSLGLGFGRLRDGSFVFRALRVVERLREDGVITRSLSRSEMLDLAARIATRREYTTNFERSDKYFVKDIVDDLTSLGVIAPGVAVTSYSAMRILESFTENIQSRFFGWRVFYMINDAHDQYGSHSSMTLSDGTLSAEQRIDNSWLYVSRFGFQYGRPLSLLTHLYAEATLDLPNHDAAARYALRVIGTVSHQAGERLLLVGSYQYSGGSSDALLSLFSLDSDAYTRSFNHTFQGNFVYFLEDQLHFRTTLVYSVHHRSSYGFSIPYYPSSSTTSGFSLSFSLVYNLI
jgi:hypothetical protein